MSDSLNRSDADQPIGSPVEPEVVPSMPLDVSTAANPLATPEATSADEPVAAVETTPAAPASPDRRTRPAARAAAPKPLSPYAVIETGGKQYRVSIGESLAVERLEAEPGSDVTIDRVLLLGGDGGTRVGTPTVSGATVSARVEDHYRGEKIVVFKYKPKKRYRRRTGHRQSLTRLTITGINA